MLPAVARGLALLGALTLPIHAQSVHVDPVDGADLVGRGTPARPYRSLTFAVANHAGGGGVAEFVLESGRYSVATGEVWPIELPTQCVLRAATAPGSGAVVFEIAPGADALFRHAHDRPGFLTVDGVEAVGAGGALLEVAASGPLGYANATLRNCRSELPDGCRFTGRGGGSGALLLEDCEIRAITGALRVVAPFPSTLQLRADRSTLIGGLTTVDLDATGGGLIAATLRGCEVRDGALHGVRCRTDLAGNVALTLEHVLLANCGNGASPPRRGAALAVEAAAGGNAPVLLVRNGIFAGNAADAPIGGAGCTFGVNLVQQTDLLGLGGNRGGAPRFVDPADGDYRLAPTSAGIDAGDPAAVTLWTDRDREPRIELLPDLGPDEQHRHAVHAIGSTELGTRWEFAITTDPAAPFGLVVGTARRPGSFGPGRVHLDGTLVPTTIGGIADLDGVGRFDLGTPADPRLIGLELFWQAFAGAIPEIGANAWRTVARP